VLVLQRISEPVGEAMSGTYRDDLEAALLRAHELEREVAELRERNQRLEANPARGQGATIDNCTRPVVLQATRGGRLVASLVVGSLGATVVGDMFHEGMNTGAVVFTILFGSFVAWLNTIPRVDPPGRSR
jgi:hypothetical protein